MLLMQRAIFTYLGYLPREVLMAFKASAGLLPYCTIMMYLAVVGYG